MICSTPSGSPSHCHSSSSNATIPILKFWFLHTPFFLSFFRNPASSPTKLLCFPRSSPLIHQLPAKYPSSIFEAQVAGNAQQTLHDLVFANPSQLVVCKLSNILTQSSVQQMLKGFVQSDTDQVSLCARNIYAVSYPAS